MRIHSLKLLMAGAVSALLLASCSSDPKLQSALLVTVKVDPLALSSCVRVVVTPQSGGEAQATAPITRKDEIKVAVYRANGWSNAVSVVARGYANCDADTALDAQIEKSDAQPSEFPGSGTAEVVLNLKPSTTVTDADGDGDPLGQDCDDNDPNRFHANTEACTDTVDKNCSGNTGCEDSACTGGCGSSGAGTCQGGTCVGGTEAIDCADGQDNDSDGLTDCADPDCAGLSCNDGNACTGSDICQSGNCVGSAIPVNCPGLVGGCASDAGYCNPVDGGCLYPLKPAGSNCNDGDACTTADKCQADGTCVATGTPVSCSTPPNTQCFDTAGTCNPADAGCSYTTKPVNTTCDDSNLCTDSDVCQANGTCAGAPKVCNTPPTCKTGSGTCNTSTGTCTYTQNSTNGTSCNDGNGCTQTDTCNAGNCIGSNPKTCAPTNICEDAGTCTPATGACTNPQITCKPNECQTGGACVVGTGCQFQNKQDGTSCAGASGTCQSGACVPNYTKFAYDPFDFKADGGVPGAAVTLNCATTAVTGATGAVLNLCDGGTVALQTITQTDNATQASFLSVKGFTMTSTAQLTVTGSLPLIIAVYGDADVDGTINVSASGSASGPGANLACPSADLSGDSSVTTSGDTGAAGGASTGNGGNGGNGNANTSHPNGQTAFTPGALVGGCSGGVGGSTAPTGQRPRGGGGGGALQISAAGNLNVSAIIAAAGGGGAGGKGGAKAALYGEGGGGGGSAGTIVLEGQSLTIRASGKLTANGGSGGEGGNGSIGENGNNGLDGSMTDRATTPNGGDAANKAGNGGVGGGANTLTGGNGTNGANDSAGGGGGGGGGGAAGRIVLHSNGAMCRETNHVISPSNNLGTNGGFFLFASNPTTSATCP